MNKEERVKLIFETLSKIVGFEIKPDKEFYMTVNGEKDIYKIDENSNLYCKMPEGYFRPSGYTIIPPIFKGGYQLEEIEEPLLTNDEKEFLRYFNCKAVSKEELSRTTILYIMNRNNIIVSVVKLNGINLSFDGLKANREYNEKELGL